MTAPASLRDRLDRTACQLFAEYGKEAALVAYTKAVYCEAQSCSREARRWREVLGRVVAIDTALDGQVSIPAGKAKGRRLISSTSPSTGRLQ